MIDIFPEVYELFSKIERPVGDESLFIPDYKGKPVGNLDKNQALLLGHLLSKYVFPGESARYIILPLQSAYDLIHSNTETGEGFKRLNQNNFFHNGELLLEEGKVILDPIIQEFRGELEYDGKSIESKIQYNLYRTLKESGVFEESKTKPKIESRETYFKNGVASVWSRWDKGKDCFVAGACKPSFRSPYGLVAYEKTNKKPELEMMRILKSEFKKLTNHVETLTNLVDEL